LQSRRSAVIIGIAAVAAVAIIIVVAISMIPEHVRKEGQSPTANNTSGAANEGQVSREYKISTTTGSINSPYATEYKLLNGTWPSGTMVDGKGNVWTVGSQSRALLKFVPAT
jgi:streptogramin lyase